MATMVRECMGWEDTEEACMEWEVMVEECMAISRALEALLRELRPLSIS